MALDAKENPEINYDELEEKIDGVLKDNGYTEESLQDLNIQVQQAYTMAESAKAISNNAVSAAQQMGDGAYKSANEAIAAIKDIGAGSTSWAKRIVGYSVGEYSQAYGLTWEQAKSALEHGIIHIPTVIHTEEYIGMSDVYKQEFMVGYYYEWNGETWTSSLSTAVNFSSAYIGGATQTPYWVVTEADVEYNGVIYKLGHLYKWENGAWVETGSSVAENTLSRAVSAIHQSANQLSMEVSDVRGSVAAVNVRVDGNETSVQTLASWVGKDGQKRNIATIDQSADQDGSKIALVVVKDAEDEVLSGASIVLNDSEKGSYINIDADNIVMTGTTTFLTPSDVGESGSTVISGSRITTGEIDAQKVNVKNLRASSIMTTSNQTVEEAIDKSIVSNYI
jgi:hypothetical protein